jgi:hypothetical protein
VHDGLIVLVAVAMIIVAAAMGIVAIAFGPAVAWILGG